MENQWKKLWEDENKQAIFKNALENKFNQTNMIKNRGLCISQEERRTITSNGILVSVWMMQALIFCVEKEPSAMPKEFGGNECHHISDSAAHYNKLPKPNETWVLLTFHAS